MKKLHIAILGLTTVSFNVLAEESYSTYVSVGAAYILDQPSDIHNKEKTHVQKLYEGDKYSYHIETGINVPTETGNAFRLGLYWSDLLNQGESKKYNRPYKLEAFSDYVIQWDDKMFVKVGAGYKLFEQNEVIYTVDGKQYKEKLYDNPILGKLTARLAIGRTFGNYQVSLEHQSQWFQGKPINDDWEYHTTNISLSYMF